MRQLFRYLRSVFALLGLALVGGYVVVYIFFYLPCFYTFELLDKNKFVISNEAFNVVAGLVIAIVLGLFLFLSVKVIKRIFKK